MPRRTVLSTLAPLGIVLATGGAAVAQPVPAAAPTSRVAAAASAAFDFGDAPDGSAAGYSQKPLARGSFPSRAGRGGPRHPPGPRIGTSWTAEPDSRQVDRDRDDGVQLNPRRCAVSTLTLVLDASRAPAGTPLYVNAWFDWNQDGDWADGGTSRCGPEWGIQNMRIDPASLGRERVAAVTLRFRAGTVPAQFWWRVQVHAGEPVPHAGGGGQAAPTRGGETEDLFFNRLRPLPEPRVRLRCETPAGVISHGRTHHARFVLVGGYGARVAPRKARVSLSGLRDGVKVDGRAFPPRQWLVSVQSTREHERDPVVQTVKVRLEVDFLVNGRKQIDTATCSVAIVHAKSVAPPFQPPPIDDPVPTGAAIDPIRPDPVKARCAALFEPIGWTPGQLGAQGGRVYVSCAGVDVKSMSVGAGSGSQRIASFGGDCVLVTVNGVERRALQCFARRGNKGTVVGFDYRTDSAFASVTLRVLAGGSSNTRGGTTFVLVQTFHFLPDGVRCSQDVPAASACANSP